MIREVKNKFPAAGNYESRKDRIKFLQPFVGYEIFMSYYHHFSGANFFQNDFWYSGDTKLKNWTTKGKVFHNFSSFLKLITHKFIYLSFDF